MGKDLTKVDVTFYPCDGGSCRKAGSENTTREIRCHLFNSGKWDDIHTIRTRCNGRCEDAPTMIVHPGNYWYKNVDPERGVDIVKSHLEKKQPLREALLFEENGDQLNSDNERSNSFIKPFEEKTLPTGNYGWMTKGLSSDQYLYPLMKKCLELDIEGSYQDPQGNTRDLRSLSQVIFIDAYTMELRFGEEISSLLIGAVPKSDTTQRQEDKVRGTYYFIESNEIQKGIQFRNRKGEAMGTLLFKSDAFWEYCTDIQLKGIKIPEEVH